MAAEKKPGQAAVSAATSAAKAMFFVCSQQPNSRTFAVFVHSQSASQNMGRYYYGKTKLRRLVLQYDKRKEKFGITQGTPAPSIPLFSVPREHSFPKQKLRVGFFSFFPVSVSRTASNVCLFNEIGCKKTAQETQVLPPRRHPPPHFGVGQTRKTNNEEDGTSNIGESQRRKGSVGNRGRIYKGHVTQYGEH